MKDQRIKELRDEEIVAARHVETERNLAKGGADPPPTHELECFARSRNQESQDAWCPLGPGVVRPCGLDLLLNPDWGWPLPMA